MAIRSAFLYDVRYLGKKLKGHGRCCWDTHKNIVCGVTRKDKITSTFIWENLWVAKREEEKKKEKSRNVSGTSKGQ